MRRILASCTVAVALWAVPSAAMAAPKPASTGSASCAVSGTVVNATGLPVGEVINFMVTDSSGARGWVLGYTDDGTWSVSVPTPIGPTTYQFVSRTSGPNGTKYTISASCS
jgi:hypothetical protein